ncbi:glycosyl hydrolase family 8 [Clostridium sp.]|uniref:glycosyl hydrolase family 8 n=1 Tax=Clostridium sp. TaxID=1506 RepID=UPI0026173EDA|nr:glycosyl hydrolase family 8 [Clostridium sp.]
MKRFLIIVSIILVIGIVFVGVNREYFKSVHMNVNWSDNFNPPEEEKLLNFIESNLSKSGYGIYTNYLDKNSEGDITKGHSVLSESEGLIMLYAVNADKKELFDNNFDIVKKMRLKNGLISWRKDGDKNSSSSATIDELRIIKALLLANNRWGNFYYKFYAVNIANSLLKHAEENGTLVDYIDEYGKGNTTTLCYLDLPVMKLLGQLDPKWNEVYKKSNLIIENGKVSSEVPLYRKVFYEDTKKYDEDKNIDLLLSTIVILNRIEANENEEASIKWIKDNFKKDGFLVATYDSKSGEPTSKIESPSIYANVALIANHIGDEKLFNKAIDKLKYYQIDNKESLLYGGFGDEKNNSVYSFDNLNALLAFQKYKE